MKTIRLTLFILGLLHLTATEAQSSRVFENSLESWSVFNREVQLENGIVHLNAQEDDGILWLKEYLFKNGTIEFDIKGKDSPGRSFVGLAFHGEDNTTFDAIYFRPFNFKNPEKKDKSVQYISMPENGWAVLRKAFPGKYENTISPLPENVEDWFHVKIVVNHPLIKVYINSSEEPTLVVDQISDQKEGSLGFWVGNGSEGWFKNLAITKN